MLTETGSAHLARVRLAAEGDELRHRMLIESKNRVGESLRAERAEAAAEEMALSLTQAEYAAREAAYSANDLRAELEGTQHEVEALREALANMEKAHVEAQAALRAEHEAERRTLRDAHDAAVAERASVEDTLQRATLAHQNALAAAVEDREYVTAEMDERALEHKYLLRAMAAMAKHEQRQVRRALEPWCHLGWRRGAHRLVVAKRTRKCLAAGFSALHQPAVVDGLRGTAARAVSAMRHRFRRRALSQWAHFVHQRRAYLGAHGAGVSAFRQHGLLRAYLSWEACVSAQQQRRHAMGVAGREWRGGSARKAFASWKELHDVRQKTRRGYASFIRRSFCACYLFWRDQAAIHSVPFRRLRTVLKALDPQGRRMRRALFTMREATSSRQLLRRVGRRWKHLSKARALSTWLEMYRERLVEIDWIRRGLLSLRAGGLARAYRAWVEAAEMARERMRMLRVSAAEMFGSGLRLAWNTLVEWIENERQMDVTMRMLLERNKKRAFNAFTDLVISHGQAIRRIRAALKTCDPVGREMRKALNSMRYVSSHGQQLRAAAAGLLHRTKRVGLNTWRACFLDTVHEHAILRRSAQAMRHRGLSNAYRTWVARAAGSAEANRRLRQAAGRFRQSALHLGWDQWRARHLRCKTAGGAFLSLRRRAARLATNKWREVAHQSRVRKAFRKAHGGEASVKRKGFQALREGFEERRARRQAVRRLRLNREARALEAWSAGIESARAKVRALARGSMVGREQCLRAVCALWRVRCGTSLAQKHKMRQSLHAMRGAGLRKALAAFVDHSTLLQRMRSALRHMRQRKASLGYRSWCDLVRGRHEMRAQLASTVALFGLPSRQMQQAWAAWLGAHRLRLRLRACFLSALRAQTARAYRSWVQGARIAKEQNENTPMAIKRALSAFQHRHLSLGFRTWAEIAGELTRHINRARSAVREWAHGGGLRKGWFTWLEYACDMGSLRARLFSMANRGLTKAFVQWLELAEEASARRAIAQGAAKDLMMGGGYRAAWKAWLACAAAARTAKRAGLAMLNARTVVAMNTWRAATTSRRTVAMRMLNITREMQRRALQAAFAKMRHRELIQQWTVMTHELWLRPRFFRWVATWYLQRFGRPQMLGARNLFRRWVAAWEQGVRRAHADFLVGRERLRACHKGRLVLRSLRHSGMRGVLGVWRHAMLSGRPGLTHAWIVWRANATRMPVARAFRRKHVKRLLARGFAAFELARDARVLEDKLEALHAGRKAKLKVWRTEIMSAERHSLLLRKALEKAHAKARSELEAVERERDAALKQARSMELRANAEHRAALQVLSKEAPTHSPPKLRLQADRWSTAAARGQAHASVSASKLEDIFRAQRETNEEMLLRSRSARESLKTTGNAALIATRFSGALQRRREAEGGAMELELEDAPHASDTAREGAPSDSAAPDAGTPGSPSDGLSGPASPSRGASETVPPIPTLARTLATAPRLQRGSIATYASLAHASSASALGRASSSPQLRVEVATPSRPAWGSARALRAFVEPARRAASPGGLPTRPTISRGPSAGRGLSPEITDLFTSLD